MSPVERTGEWRGADNSLEVHSPRPRAATICTALRDTYEGHTDNVGIDVQNCLVDPFSHCT